MQKKIKNKKVKKYYLLRAGSLLYAIIISVLIALLIGSMILTTSIYKRINDKQESDDELRNECNNLFDYCLSKPNENISDFLKNDKIMSTYEFTNWGAYNILSASVYSGQDSVFKTGLIGIKKKVRKNLALFLTDFNKPLKLMGKATISGEVMMSSYGISIGTIDNIKYTGDIQLIKTIGKSNKKLPPINDFIVNKNDVINLSFEEFKDKNIAYNSFLNQTIVVNINNIKDIGHIKISGNIILKSNDSLTIHRTAILKDIIIEAPKVNFESGFRGSLQVYAKKTITLQRNVVLLYPSILYLKADLKEKVIIKIKDRCVVMGGVFLSGDKNIYDNNREMIIDKKALIVGDIYCQGNIHLKGRIDGTVYTNNFLLKTKTTTYDNYILDGLIYSEKRPINFINTLLINQNDTKNAFIKEL